MKLRKGQKKKLYWCNVDNAYYTKPCERYCCTCKDEQEVSVTVTGTKMVK